MIESIKGLEIKGDPTLADNEELWDKYHKLVFKPSFVEVAQHYINNMLAGYKREFSMEDAIYHQGASPATLCSSDGHSTRQYERAEMLIEEGEHPLAQAILKRRSESDYDYDDIDMVEMGLMDELLEELDFSIEDPRWLMIQHGCYYVSPIIAYLLTLSGDFDEVGVLEGDRHAVAYTIKDGHLEIVDWLLIFQESPSVEYSLSFVGDDYEQYLMY